MADSGSTVIDVKPIISHMHQTTNVKQEENELESSDLVQVDHDVTDEDRELAQKDIQFMISQDSDLSYAQVKRILEDLDKYLVHSIPDKPEAGTLYCVDFELLPNWHDDGYQWKRSVNIDHQDHPNFKVQTFLPVHSSQVQKIVYYVEEQPSIGCVQYCSSEGFRNKLSDKERKTRKGLTIEEAVTLLKNCEGTVSASRAIRPKGGEIYLFDTDIIGGDWKCDDYVWRNCGTAYVPSKHPVMKKTFFSIRTPKSGEKGSTEFQKVAYVSLERQNIVMVQYIGDETVYVPMKHGNRKRGSVEHKRTCPSVLEKIKKGVTEGSEQIYLRPNTGADGPRNMQQIFNMKHRYTKRKLLPTPEETSPKETKLIKLSQTDDINIQTETVITVDEHGRPNLPPGYAIVDVSAVEEEAEEIEDKNMLQPVLEHVESPTIEEESQEGFFAEDEVSQNDSGLEATEFSTDSKANLDPHPEISKLQREILEQQEMNLKLMKEKMRLEGESAQGEIQTLTPTSVAPISSQLVENNQIRYIFSGQEHGQQQIIVTDEAGASSTLGEQSVSQNVVYVQGTDGSQQMVFIEEPSAQALQ